MAAAESLMQEEADESNIKSIKLEEADEAEGAPIEIEEQDESSEGVAVREIIEISD